MCSETATTSILEKDCLAVIINPFLLVLSSIMQESSSN